MQDAAAGVSQEGRKRGRKGVQPPHLAQGAQLVVLHHLGEAELEVAKQGDQLGAVGRRELRQVRVGGGGRRVCKCRSGCREGEGRWLLRQRGSALA